ncbi:hypothetical protein [Nonomuraea pusilla]|uniref:Ig-like domain-containing protein n=1 Tax=Nonomuraea pusilla TaxID=46177 RepID=A0A1H8E0T0_9ACTN|nr:hypothetical protein [Nonomuraea pusilla]SEN13179.1 hypothetical protein SAMN05660976_06876 [Nonomuraea pusilla]
MRLFTPLALAASATALGLGVIAAPTAQAVTPHQASTITFTCAGSGPTPHIYPPWVNALDCTPPAIGKFANVEIHIQDESSWLCQDAESRPGSPGLVNVLGKTCERLEE